MRKLLLIGLIFLSASGCADYDQQSGHEIKGRYTESFRKDFCNKLQKKIPHKVSWKDVYGDRHIMKVAFKFEPTIYLNYTYDLNCVLYTEGAKDRHEYPYSLEDKTYDNFNGFVKYVKEGRGQE